MSVSSLSLGTRSMPARIAAGFTMLFGLLSLVGWAFDIRSLTSIVPGSVEMKANTALSLLFCGAAVMILAERVSASWEGAARALGAVAAATGAATLCEYLFGWQLGIDELLFPDRLARFTLNPGRMSPYSATAFIALGLAVIGVRLRHLDRVARLAAGIVLAIGLVSLIGYLWDAGEIVTDRWLPPVAANTALCLVIIGIGVLLIPGRSQDRLGEQAALAGIEKRILGGFLAAISLLILGGSFTYRNSVEFANSVEWIAHTQEVRTSLSDLYGSLAGAEVAQRDYFLTRQQAPLDESQRLILRVHDRLDNLTHLLADNAPQLANLAKLRGLVENRIGTLSTGLTAFNDYGIPAVRAVLALSRSTNTVEDVRAQYDHMDAIEEGLLGEREASAARVRFTTLISLLITLAAAICLFIALFRGIHREMFARRHAEQALRSSDEYNRNIIDSSPDCLSVLTTGAHVTQMNPHGMALMGVDDFAGISGKDWCTFWHGEDRTAARAAVADARGGREGRFTGPIHPGTSRERWLDVIVMPVRSPNSPSERLLAVARDVTDVKRGEEKLRSANQFLDSLIQSLPVMIVLKDVETLKFVRVNRAFEELIGMKREQLIGRGAQDLFVTEEADLVIAKDREALQTGKLVDIQQTIRTPHLGVRTFQTMKLPILDGRGEPQFLLAISVDVTERQLAEVAIRELNLAMASKAAQLESTNKELESFSYSVSHDLRAPLRAIDGFAEMIEEDYRDKLDEEGRRYLGVIRSNSRRMGALIDDLLSFSRLGRQAVNQADVNMDALVQEVVGEVLNADVTHRTVDASSTPSIDVGPLPAVHGDRTLLRQVWINLVSNAVKYSGKSPNPHIEIRGTTVGEENHYTIRDNGVGFNMEYVNKLFGVFNRLHRADEFSGTGVGLAIVQRIVARHGGRVWAEGKVNDGAVFSIALPRGSHSG